MPIHIADLEEFDIYVGDVEICEGYVGTALFFSCDGSLSGVIVSSNSVFLTSKTYIFKTADFTKDFQAGENTYNDVIIKSLPNVPQLKYLGSSIAFNQVVNIANVGGLKFELPDNYAIYNGVLYVYDSPLAEMIEIYEDLGYKLIDNQPGALTFADKDGNVVTEVGIIIENENLIFNFITTDTENRQSNIAQFSLIPQGNVNVFLPYINRPPNIGDSTSQLIAGETLIFTREMFTTQTTPPYNDPEGDAALLLKVTSLPSNGTLYLNNLSVSCNDIINFRDIDKGLFTFVPDIDIEDGAIESFTFEIADEGSGIFSS